MEYEISRDLTKRLNIPFVFHPLIFKTIAQHFHKLSMRMTSSHKPLRWGIISAGKICFDFCVSLSTLPKENHIVTHVAARSLERAKEFATTFDIESVSDSYTKVMEDENVDVVYIGTLNTTHKELSILAMNHGKPVLCEKPATMNSSELEEVLKVAKEKNVFYMEGVWARCFPIWHDLKSKFGDGSLGEPNVLLATYGNAYLCELPRINSPEYGGSVLLTIGIYLLTLADFIFEGHSLIELKACGNVDEASNVDRMVAITMRFQGNKIAQLLVDGDHTFSRDANIFCSKGKVNIEGPFYCSTKYTEDYGNEKRECIFPLPKTEKETNYINSEGLRFEAEHMRECLQKGLKESPLVSHDTSRRIMGYMDEIRRQIGSTHAL